MLTRERNEWYTNNKQTCQKTKRAGVKRRTVLHFYVIFCMRHQTLAGDSKKKQKKHIVEKQNL